MFYTFILVWYWFVPVLKVILGSEDFSLFGCRQFGGQVGGWLLARRSNSPPPWFSASPLRYLPHLRSASPPANISATATSTSSSTSPTRCPICQWYPWSRSSWPTRSRTSPSSGSHRRNRSPTPGPLTMMDSSASLWPKWPPTSMSPGHAPGKDLYCCNIVMTGIVTVNFVSNIVPPLWVCASAIVPADGQPFAFSSLALCVLSCVNVVVCTNAINCCRW